MKKSILPSNIKLIMSFKKRLVLFNSTFLMLVVLFFIVGGQNLLSLGRVQGDEPTYTIIMDASNSPTDSATFTMVVSNNRYNQFSYSDAKANSGNHIELNAGGYIKNSSNSRITSITSVTAVFYTIGTLNLQTSFYGETFTPATLTSGVTHDLSASLPYFLRFTAIDASVIIASITICYSCSPHEESLHDETLFIVSSATGTSHSIALSLTGRVYAWGRNDYGQLGDDTTTERRIPTEITERIEGTVIQLAGGERHSIALTSTGRVYTWGTNFHGQLGNDSPIQSEVPIEITERITGTATHIAAGQYHSLLLTSTGQVFAWGGNSYGQLGDGTLTNKLVPIDITSRFPDTITHLTAGRYHSLALTSTGLVYAWGRNDAGQLAIDDLSRKSIPIEITDRITGTVIQLAGGEKHSMALTSTGRVYTWGDNFYGTLGDDSTTHSKIPIEITERITGTVTQLEAGTNFSMALTSTGRVYMWGWNNYNQLGDGTSTQRNVPTEITNNIPGTVIQLAEGSHHSMALTDTGRLYTWGRNNYGQLGDNTSTQRSLPTHITNRFK